MADAGAELISQGVVKPSPLESVGKFVKEKIIDPHTPEAHYRDIMKKYFWVTDKLEGTSLELTRRLRPQIEIVARAAGWSQTFTELYFAGQAAAFVGFLGLRGLRSAAGVFREMGRRHGGESVPATVVLSKVGASAAATGVSINAQANESASSAADGAVLSSADRDHGGKDKSKHPHDKVQHNRVDVMSAEPKKKHLSAKARRNREQELRRTPVRRDHEVVQLGRQTQSASVPDLGGNGRDTQHVAVRSALSQDAILKSWSAAFDTAIGTDATGAAQKDATLRLLNTMMMDKSDGGFFSILVGSMAEPNAVVRKQMVETAVNEAAQAFGANDETATAAQLLIEHMTNKPTALSRTA